MTYSFLLIPRSVRAEEATQLPSRSCFRKGFATALRASSARMVVSALLLCLTACKSIGPEQIYLDRGRYNDAIVNTQDEQVLANIVRLRYMHQVSVLKISSIVASYTLTPSLKGALSTTNHPNAADAIGLNLGPEIKANAGVLYSDQPTISYMPVTGTEFIRNMLVPIQTQYLALLVSGGMHDPRLIFNLTIRELNGIDNATDASDLKTVAPPTYQAFHHFSYLLDKLAKKKGVKLDAIKVRGELTLVLNFSPHCSNAPEAREIKAILRVPKDAHQIILSRKKLPFPNSAVIDTRSILGTLIFLSHGVDVPAAHVKAHLAPQYVTAGQHAYDWRPLMRGVIHIRSSKRVPVNAFLKVYLYGYWYYIARGDVYSIATFTYLNTLRILAAGETVKRLGLDQRILDAQGVTRVIDKDLILPRP